jgi:hypothetical protein
MVAPTSQQHDAEPDPMQQAIPQSPTGMGAHGWSRMIVGIILLAALATIVVRGIYVISTLEDETPAPVQTETP